MPLGPIPLAGFGFAPTPPQPSPQGHIEEPIKSQVPKQRRGRPVRRVRRPVTPKVPSQHSERSQSEHPAQGKRNRPRAGRSAVLAQ